MGVAGPPQRPVFTLPAICILAPAPCGETAAAVYLWPPRSEITILYLTLGSGSRSQGEEEHREDPRRPIRQRWGALLRGAFFPRLEEPVCAQGCFPKSSKAARRRGWAATGSFARTVPLRAGSGVPVPPKNSVSLPCPGWILCRAGVSLPSAGTAAPSLPVGQPEGSRAQVRTGGREPERGSAEPPNDPRLQKIGGSP